MVIFLCKENLTPQTLREELGLNFYHHLFLLSSHERLNGEIKMVKIKLYFEVLIFSMMFDFIKKLIQQMSLLL